MTTAKEIPLLFTPDNRAAVRAGIKTETRRNAGIKPRYGCPQKNPVRYWVKEPVQVLEVGLGPSPSCIQAKVLYLDTKHKTVIPINHPVYQKLASGKPLIQRSTNELFMFKSFTRTWLRGKSVHPERLGDITAEGAIAEGIEVDPEMSGVEDYKGDLFERQLILERRKVLAYSPVWRDYLNGGYDLLPIQSYVSLWQSIHGPDPWDPQRWVWVVQFEAE